MSQKILLLGVLDSILADVQQQVAHPDFEFFRGTSLEREIFQSSDTTNVHMKSHLPRSEGFLPFVQAVLRGLTGSEG